MVFNYSARPQIEYWASSSSLVHCTMLHVDQSLVWIQRIILKCLLAGLAVLALLVHAHLQHSRRPFEADDTEWSRNRVWTPVHIVLAPSKPSPPLFLRSMGWLVQIMKKEGQTHLSHQPWVWRANERCRDGV